MTTVVNNPTGVPENDGGMGVTVMVLVFVVIVAVLFFVYGLPAMRRSETNVIINPTPGTTTSPGPTTFSTPVPQSPIQIILPTTPVTVVPTTMSTTSPSPTGSL